MEKGNGRSMAMILEKNLLCKLDSKWNVNKHRNEAKMFFIIFHFAVNAAAEYEMKQIWRKKPLTIFAEKNYFFKC